MSNNAGRTEGSASVWNERVKAWKAEKYYPEEWYGEDPDPVEEWEPVVSELDAAEKRYLATAELFDVNIAEEEDIWERYDGMSDRFHQAKAEAMALMDGCGDIVRFWKLRSEAEDEERELKDWERKSGIDLEKQWFLCAARRRMGHWRVTPNQI